jgi:hypothetical protein
MKIIKCCTCNAVLPVNEGTKINNKWYCDDHIIKKFTVTTKEIYDQSYIVKANNKDDAIKKVKDGDGEIDEASFEYNRIMSSRFWTVEVTK